MKASEIILIISLFVVALVFSAVYQRNNEPRICFEETCFLIEIADEQSERTQGLMFREQMDSDRGMLFIFEQESNYPFWMKDTILPLDIIWLNSDKEIVFIKANAEPYSTIPIEPGKNAKYVLEINSGIAEKMDLEIGAKASISGI